MSDDDDDARLEDPDRIAILARRRRFIALALSGLAGTAACDKARPTSPPQPCLNVASPEPPASDTDDVPTDTDGTPTDTDGTPTDAPPQPCLDVAAPQPCLEAPMPQPCLDVAAPQPCLEVAAPPPAGPAPCLDVGPPQPPPKPKPAPKARPRPCLDVAPQVCLMIRKSDDDDGEPA